MIGSNQLIVDIQECGSLLDFDEVYFKTIITKTANKYEIVEPPIFLGNMCMLKSHILAFTMVLPCN